MDAETIMKAAIVVDEALPVGLKANCGAVLGVSLGALHPEIVGPDLYDASGGMHPGITGLPIPILSATRERIRRIVDDGGATDGITVIGFNDVAQSCTSYDEYRNKLGSTARVEVSFLAVLIVGGNRRVNRLTGTLPLAR